LSKDGRRRELYNIIRLPAVCDRIKNIYMLYKLLYTIVKNLIAKRSSWNILADDLYKLVQRSMFTENLEKPLSLKKKIMRIELSELGLARSSYHRNLKEL